MKPPLGGVLAAVLVAASAARAGAGRFLDDPVMIAEHVKANAEDLDWRKIFPGPERLIYLGERHTDVRPKEELARHMRDAAAAGITHLAIEMLGEDRRDLLERYDRRGVSDEELIAAFSRDWGPKDRGFMPEEYVKVLSAAREAGIRVEPLDFAVADKEDARHACASRGSEARCDDEELQSRDDRMMSGLARVLAKPETGRVLAWTGSWHACALEQAAKLAGKGIPSRSYYLITKGRYERDSGLIRYVDAVEKQGWRERRLLIRTQGVQACFSGLISMPGADVPPASREP